MSNFRQVQVGEVTLRVALQGGGPLVVMVHGFPESWYSWRHQMGPIAAAGFTACAIDVRGYGGSDKPHEIEAYSLEHLSGDVAGLIAALSPDKPAVVIGHDWGAPIGWTTALVHPDRVRAATTTSASLSSPAFGGRSTATAITIGTSPSYGTSREAASNSRRSTSAASGTGFSRCSETGSSTAPVMRRVLARKLK
jgi:pimeloyl-ACP methyl ester carboxylesterase